MTEDRKAPPWIIAKQRKYARYAILLNATAVSVGLAGFVTCFLVYFDLAPEHVRLRIGVSFLVYWIAAEFLRPLERGKRYEAASYILENAIVRYEVGPDRPESTLIDADQQVIHVLEQPLKRTADKI